METTILSKSFDNIIEKNDFSLLKKELYKYISENFLKFDFNNVETINNFKYNELAKLIISKSYYNKNNKKEISHYIFKDPQDFFNIYDYIILYVYELTQALYIKKNIENFYHKSLTEILLINRMDFSKFGLNVEYPYHQLSKTFNNNPYIQNYLSVSSKDYLKNIDINNIKESKIKYYKIAEDIIKLLELRHGFHYKNSYFLIKDRLFALTQCLKQLDISNIEIENLLVELYNDFELPINVPDISFLANTKKYNYGLDKLSEKIKYNFVRSKDFNYYNLK